MDAPLALRRAAAYVRMSTERQTYSTVYQTDCLRDYAVARGYEIVRIYVDEGVSGLRLERRDALKGLLADVLSGQADFSIILTYDVSRWGRFQDPDQSAHYEFLCKDAGVRVEYCAEPFENDGSMTSSLAKHIKRVMAAEYSRDLSTKITHAKHGLGLKGFWPGGNPSFGLRRRQEPLAGALNLTFEPGQANGLKGRRVVVVAGPIEEVQVVRRIFRMLIAKRTKPMAIARKLNAEGVKSWGNMAWTEGNVRKVLKNELYAGVRVIGRYRTYLGEVRPQPKDTWARVSNAGEPIVSLATFRQAQQLLQPHITYSDERLLADLRLLMAEGGNLSCVIIARDPRTAGPALYRTRFGSMSAAYALVGYVPSDQQLKFTNRIAPHRLRGAAWNRCKMSDDELLSRMADLARRLGKIDGQLIDVTPNLPSREVVMRRFGSLERAYELIGYRPTAHQQMCFDRPRKRGGA